MGRNILEESIFRDGSASLIARSRPCNIKKLGLTFRPKDSFFNPRVTKAFFLQPP